ncbi:MAG TPA: RDD family protein [Acidimicrobiales bacterium]|nr:RDD family protein [Acidimicrobiales bacterium]
MSGPVDSLGRPLAEWWQRLVAIILDSIILGIVTGLISAGIIATGHHNGSNGFFSTNLDVRHVIAGLITFVIDLGYFALLNGSEKGQTVGMMALGITVRDSSTGGRIEPQRAGIRIFILYPGILLRWIPVLGAIAGLYTIVAGLSPLWDNKREGWHDKVAKTTVIKVR